MASCQLHLRPYLHENTASRPISKVKHGRDSLVLSWETRWESGLLQFSYCLLSFFFFLFDFRPHLTFDFQPLLPFAISLPALLVWSFILCEHCLPISHPVDLGVRLVCVRETFTRPNRPVWVSPVRLPLQLWTSPGSHSRRCSIQCWGSPSPRWNTSGNSGWGSPSPRLTTGGNT